MERNRDCFESDSSGMSSWKPLIGVLLVSFLIGAAVVRVVVVGEGAGGRGGTLSVSCCSLSTMAPNPPTAVTQIQIQGRWVMIG